MNLRIFKNTALSRRISGGTKFFIVGAVVLFASCKKESDIGLDVQPDSDLLGLTTTDTVTMKTYTVREDSVRSDGSAIVQIGSLDDPGVTGTTTAGLFTQFSIANSLTNLNFSTAIFDSCVFQMRYDIDFYGDTALNNSETQTFSLYQMTESLNRDSAYYSNHEKQYYSFPVGTTTFAAHPRTQTILTTDTIPAVLRMKLDSTFASQIIHPTDPNALLDNTHFQEYFKGLYVKPTAHTGNNGALLRFSPKDTLTYLRFYYHDATMTASHYDFVINTGTAYYSCYKHDYSSGASTLNNQLATPGTNSMDYTYVQGASGLKTKIEFPNLASLQDTTFGKVIINKAELIIKADPGVATTNVPINTQLYVVYLDSIGDSYVLTDMVESADYYGGIANTGASEYKINMARYFQRLVDGDLPNNGLYLKEYNPNEFGRRAQLFSAGNTSGTKMYLHLVYTRIN